MNATVPSDPQRGDASPSTELAGSAAISAIASHISPRRAQPELRARAKARLPWRGAVHLLFAKLVSEAAAWREAERQRPRIRAFRNSGMCP
jgi:hypothetical protein